MAVLAACSMSAGSPPAPVVTLQAASSDKTILFILADDAHSETLDRMPVTLSLLGPDAGGVRLDRGLVTDPLCCPERASLLTGLYPSVTGVIDVNAHAANVFDDSITLATRFHDAGFTTGLFGKYLNQYDKLWLTGETPYVPPGWDRWLAFFRAEYTGGKFVCKGGPECPTTPVMKNFSYYGNHSTPIVFNQADAFIRSTPGDQFVWLTPYAPHDSATPEPQDKGKCASLTPRRMPSFQTQILNGPQFMIQYPLWTATQIANRDALRIRQCETMFGYERGIAQIIQALSDTGRLDNALIIYTSDNGHNYGEYRWPYDVLKNCRYLDCVRVPLLIKAPGVQARVDTTHPVSGIDLTVTMANYGGVPVPYDSTMGMDAMPMLIDPSAPWREGAYVEVRGGNPQGERFVAVYTDHDSYSELLTPNADREYYDEVSDPWQLTNQIDNPIFADRIAYLQALLATLRVN
jgi:N-acetylglucosamine-6-sulfatase